MVLIHPKLTDYGALYVAYVSIVHIPFLYDILSCILPIFSVRIHQKLYQAALYVTYILWFTYNIKLATCKPSTI